MFVIYKCYAIYLVSRIGRGMFRSIELDVQDCLFIPQNLPTDCPKEWWELYFVWATIWAIGGSLYQDQMIDYRIEFSKWFVHEFKTIKFPPHGTIFDYSIEPQSKKFELWSKSIDENNFDPELPVQVFLSSQLDGDQYRRKSLLVTIGTDK